MGVTTKDLARICGVSRTTVTRALQGTGRISPETKRKILDTATELGYQPDLAARSLVMGKSMMIGVIVVDLKNQYFPKMVDAIEKRVREDNYILNITLHEESKEMEAKLIRTLAGHRVDGLILNPVNKGENLDAIMREVGIPYVMLGLNEFDNSPSVGNDEFAAAHTAACYILQKGYRELVFVAPPLMDPDGIPNLGHEQRRRGFEEAVRVSGCRYNVIYGNDYAGQVVRYMREEAVEKPAFLCSGDVFAAKVIEELTQAGYRLVNDYGVMGFDNLDIYQNWTPKLTTVNNHIEDMGREAGEMLIRLMRGELGVGAVEIPFDIIQGQTL